MIGFNRHGVGLGIGLLGLMLTCPVFSAPSESKLHERMVAAQEEHGPTHKKYHRAFLKWGFTKEKTTSGPERKALLLEMVAAQDSIEGINDFDSFWLRNEVALELVAMGHVDDAEALLLETLQSLEKLEISTRALSSFYDLVLMKIVQFYDQQERFEDAALFHERELNHILKAGRYSKYIIAHRYDLGERYGKLAQYQKAIACFQIALEEADRAYRRSHALRIPIHGALGDVYEAIGEYPAAIKHYTRQFELRRKHFGPDAHSLAYTASSIARLYQKEQNWSQAEHHWKEAIRIRELHPDDTTLDPNNMLRELAKVNVAQGTVEKAKELNIQQIANFQNQLEEIEAQHGPEHEDTIDVVRSLARLSAAIGATDRAEHLILRLANTTQRLRGAEHPSSLNALNDVGVYYADLGQYEKALPFYKKALEGYLATSGLEQPSALITALNIAASYSKLNTPKSATPLLQAVVEVRTRTLGPTHPETLEVMVSLGSNYLATDRAADAESVFTAVLDSRMERYGVAHPDTLISLTHMAKAYVETEQIAQAEALYKRAAVETLRVHGPDHPYSLIYQQNLGWLFANSGRDDAALPILTKVLEQRNRVLGEDHIETLGTMELLAEVFLNVGREWDALPLWEQALTVRIRLHGEDHAHTMQTRGWLAWTNNLVGRYKAALPHWQKVVAYHNTAYGSEHEETLFVKEQFGHALMGAGHNEEALQIFKALYELYSGLFGVDDPKTARAAYLLSIPMANLGLHNESLELRQQFYVFRLEQYGPDAEETLFALGGLIDGYRALLDYEKAKQLAIQLFEARKNSPQSTEADTVAAAATLGKALVDAGEFETAIGHLSTAHAFLGRTKGAKHPDTLAAIANLAEVYQGSGDLKSATAMYRRVYAHWFEIAGEEHEKTMLARSDLAVVLADSGQINQAISHLEALVELRLKVSGDRNIWTFLAIDGLGMYYADANRFEDSLKLRLKAHKASEKHYGPNAPETLSRLESVAYSYGSLGNDVENLKIMAQVHEAYVGLYGKEGDKSIDSWMGLLSAQIGAGQYAVAVETAERAYPFVLDIKGGQDEQTLIFQGLLGRCYLGVGDFQKALQVFESLAEIRASLDGPEHPNTLSVRSAIAGAFIELGRVKEAASLLEWVYETRKRVLGLENTMTIRSMSDLAAALAELGEFNRAIGLNEAAYRALEARFGADHPSVLTTRSNLATGLSDVGRNQEALEHYLAVYSARQRVLGLKHPDTLASLCNVAATYPDLGEFERADQSSLECLVDTTAVMGPSHPDAWAAMYTRADVLSDLGRYDEAESLLKKVVSARSEVLGAKHPATLNSVNNLALAYFWQNRYTDAEELLAQLTADNEEVLGASHPGTLLSRANWGAALVRMGRYDEAEVQIRDALAGWDATDYAPIFQILGSKKLLAEHLSNLGNHDKAIALQREVVAAYDGSVALGAAHDGAQRADAVLTLVDILKAHGKNNGATSALDEVERLLKALETEFGENLADQTWVTKYKFQLAGFYELRHRYEEAEAILGSMYQDAQTSGKYSANDILFVGNQLANVKMQLGAFDEAENLYTVAEQGVLNTFGLAHHNTRNVFGNLALLYLQSKNYEALHKILPRIVASNEAILDNSRMGSAQDREDVARMGRSQLNVVMYSHLDVLPTDGKMAELAFEAWVRQSGRGLALQGATLKSARDAEKGDLAEQYDGLQKLKAREAALVNRVTAGRVVEAYQELLDGVRSEIEEVERQISELDEYAGEQEPLSIPAIIETMPPNSLYLQFVIYHPFESSRFKWGEPHLAVYALSSTGELKSARIGAMVDVEKRVAAFRQTQSKALNRWLYKRLIAPVVSDTHAYEHLLVAPDGALHLIPFEVLQNPEGDLLLDLTRLSYISSAAEFGKIAAYVEAPTNAPVIMSDPAFTPMGVADLDQQNRGEGVVINRGGIGLTVRHHGTGELGVLGVFPGGPADKVSIKQDDVLVKIDEHNTNGLSLEEGLALLDGETGEIVKLRVRRNGQSKLLKLKLARVPWREVTTIDRPKTMMSLTEAWAPLPGTRVEANRIAKLYPNAGLWLRDEASLANLRAVERPRFLHLATHGFYAEDNPLSLVDDNPMTRSGLVFAGANTNPSNRLLASEAATLNLEGTKLVVLSACETGLGQAVKGEGIYGLRRAFELAGARSVLMSLWPVSDEGTAVFMEGFYGRMKAGLPLGQAVRETKQEMRASEKWSDPVYWAPFVLAGDWQ